MNNMKKIFFNVLAIGVITFTACNSGGSKNEPEGHDMNNMNKDTAQHATETDDKDVKAVAVTYTNIDAKAAMSVKEIVDHYLHIKNALANDNGSEAASGNASHDPILNFGHQSFLLDHYSEFSSGLNTAG